MEATTISLSLAEQTYEKGNRLGVAGIALVVALMVLWAIVGHPPYSYYSVMKLAVAVGSGFAAYSLWRITPLLAPFSFILLAIAMLHVFGQMRRHEWLPFNWAAVMALTVTAILLAVSCLTKKISIT